MGRRKKSKECSKPIAEWTYNTRFSLKIAPSRILNSGSGVFAQESIPANTSLGEYTGEKRHISEPTDGVYSLSLDDEYYIDAFEYPRCVLAMINDSRFTEFNYNCEFKIYVERAEVWTIGPIQQGEELYIDYGDEYWTHR